MKRTVNFLILVLVATFAMAKGTPKYVFLFIGDGMGVDQVNGTEMYLAEKAGEWGVKPLLFTQFPIATVATTYSGTNSVTDSSAAGTAIATGHKTYNLACGVDMDKQPLTSVAEKAKQANKKVGITTSVGVNHATPAAFYGHQEDRSWYYEIGLDLIKSNFDFFGGSGILRPNRDHKKQERPSLFPQFEEAGYAVARGYDEYQKKAAAEKIILLQKDWKDQGALPYALDRKEDDLTLSQITEAAISHLSRNNRKGFFLMVEGGKIDWACHANDGATVFEEIIDMDKAVAIAYEFYKKHPKETLIVVTADHETGGFSLGAGGYELKLKVLAHQKMSQDGLSSAISKLRKTKENKVSWEEMKEFLAENLGFWKEFPLTWEQERKLRDEYEKSFVKGKVEFAQSLYAKSEPMAARAKEVINEIANLGWTTGSHTGGYVPVYAIGAGAEEFNGKLNNTDIAKKIIKVAKY